MASPGQRSPRSITRRIQLFCCEKRIAHSLTVKSCLSSICWVFFVHFFFEKLMNYEFCPDHEPGHNFFVLNFHSRLCWKPSTYLYTTYILLEYFQRHFDKATAIYVASNVMKSFHILQHKYVAASHFVASVFCNIASANETKCFLEDWTNSIGCLWIVNVQIVQFLKIVYKSPNDVIGWCCGQTLVSFSLLASLSLDGVVTQFPSLPD